MGGIRRSHEDPTVIARFGWRYHHLGIPHGSPRSGERHLRQLGVHVCGFETSPYGIEWMRFDPQCRVPEIVKTVPHVAFAVDDLVKLLANSASIPAREEAAWALGQIGPAAKPAFKLSPQLQATRGRAVMIALQEG